MFVGKSAPHPSRVSRRVVRTPRRVVRATRHACKPLARPHRHRRRRRRRPLPRQVSPRRGRRARHVSREHLRHGRARVRGSIVVESARGRGRRSWITVFHARERRRARVVRETARRVRGARGVVRRRGGRVTRGRVSSVRRRRRAVRRRRWISSDVGSARIERGRGASTAVGGSDVAVSFRRRRTGDGVDVGDERERPGETVGGVRLRRHRAQR